MSLNWKYPHVLDIRTGCAQKVVKPSVSWNKREMAPIRYVAAVPVGIFVSQMSSIWRMYWKGRDMKKGLDKLIADIEASREAYHNTSFKPISTYTCSVGDEALIYGLAEIRDALRRIGSSLFMISPEMLRQSHKLEKDAVLHEPLYIPVHLHPTNPRRDFPTINVHMATKEWPQGTLCGIEFILFHIMKPCTVVPAPLDEGVTCEFCIALSMGLNLRRKTPENVEER